MKIGHSSKVLIMEVKPCFLIGGFKVGIRYQKFVGL